MHTALVELVKSTNAAMLGPSHERLPEVIARDWAEIVLASHCETAGGDRRDRRLRGSAPTLTSSVYSDASPSATISTSVMGVTSTIWPSSTAP